MTIDQLAEQLRRIEAETAAMVAAARLDVNAPVDGCPGWDVAKLCQHLGTVQRWSATALRTSTQPDRSTLERPEPGGEVDYLAGGVTTLLDALRNRHAEDPVWNFSKAPQVASFWARRQMHEVVIHRWDAQRAVGEPDPIDPAVAIDGIDELFDIFVPLRLGGRDGIDIGGSVHLHCTDVPEGSAEHAGEWTFHTSDGIFSLHRGHAKGDCALRGRASDLLLMLWRRIAPTAESLTAFGDTEVLDRWLALGAP